MIRIIDTIKLSYNMGKGDKKTKRGKIVKGTYGANRPRKEKNAEAATKNAFKSKKASK